MKRNSRLLSWPCLSRFFVIMAAFMCTCILTDMTKVPHDARGFVGRWLGLFFLPQNVVAESIAKVFNALDLPFSPWFVVVLFVPAGVISLLEARALLWIADNASGTPLIGRLGRRRIGNKKEAAANTSLDPTPKGVAQAHVGLQR